jgi:hypothetical protein
MEELVRTAERILQRMPVTLYVEQWDRLLDIRGADAAVHARA